MASEPASEPTKETTPTIHYPERLSYEGPDYVPQEIEIAEWDHTVKGYLNWEWEYKETARALNLDFKHYISSLTPDELTAFSEAKIAKINEGRVEQGAKPVDPNTIDPALITHWLRPDWHTFMPKSGDADEINNWESFKNQWPEHIKINLDGLRTADEHLRAYTSDEALREEIQEDRAEKMKVIRAAVNFHKSGKKIDGLYDEVATVYKNAGQTARPLTSTEHEHIQRIKDQEKEIRENRGKDITSAEMRDEVKKTLKNLIDRERRLDFERGLVMTKQMKDIIEEVLPSIVRGRPILFVGDTGGAKTALAEYISREYMGVEPEFISGFADVNSYQLMGKTSLRNQESIFDPGAVTKAMEEGKILILDEINSMPPEFLKRLNKILQLRPGDKYTIQEDSGREVTVKAGFAILATANEKSKRYKGVEDFSIELLNRFGPNVIRINYPDSDIVFGNDPVENLIIARAAASDRRGELADAVDADELLSFVKAAHISQQVFTGNYGDGYKDFVKPENIVDKKPGLEETVLAPRTMVGIIEKLVDAHGARTLDDILRRHVEGIKNNSDRMVMIQILQGQGFLKAPTTSSAPDPFSQA